ncbi:MULTISPECIES: YidB family protein [Nguyenibacter]|uniref:Uncharacterized protein n=1 Tax=Nguyenibacter vanlangensis TaxID=1216886 RepID=A0A7Y7IX40_9PROT|nr:MULTISPECIES: YidB family protein [Nguyenibacter]NVN11653.1 hypothetical protein [Nguyenibacter vanlangensis]WRH88558.1 YidB family protein [Nguyenibacter sp. L1]
MSLAKSASALGDFLTGARYDHSGLISALNEYLDRVRREHGLYGFADRAAAAGYGDIVMRWRTDHEAGPATEEMVRALFTPSDLDWFAEQTGLSARAVELILARQLPNVIYKRAHATTPH